MAWSLLPVKEAIIIGGMLGVGYRLNKGYSAKSDMSFLESLKG